MAARRGGPADAQHPDRAERPALAQGTAAAGHPDRARPGRHQLLRFRPRTAGDRRRRACRARARRATGAAVAGKRRVCAVRTAPAGATRAGRCRPAAGARRGRQRRRHQSGGAGGPVGPEGGPERHPGAGAAWRRHAVRPRRPGARRDRHRRRRRQAHGTDPRHRGAMGAQQAARRPRAGQRLRRGQQLRAEADVRRHLVQQLGRRIVPDCRHRRPARLRRPAVAAARPGLAMVCGAVATVRLVVGRPVRQRAPAAAARLQRAQRQHRAGPRTGQLG